MAGEQVIQAAARIGALLQERMGVKGRDLQRQLRVAGRRLPRRVRTDALSVARAAEVARNPKLARMVDEASVARAARNVIAHLETIDPREAMKDRVLWALGKVSAFGIAVFVVMVYVAWKRGLV